MSSSPNKYLQLAVSFLTSLIGAITVKVIWVYSHQPEMAPSIRLLALWFPLQYIAFALYYFYVELRLGRTDCLRTAQRRDGYTYFGWLIVFSLIIGYRDIGPWEFWFAVAYFTILMIKLLIVILFWLDSRKPPEDKSDKPFPRGLDIFIILFFLYFFISPWVDKITPPQGDEPYFLLLTHSMIYDHDINLYNNFIHKDYLKFSPLITHQLTPQPQDIIKPGYYLSHHFPMFPALLIPGYALAGRIGVIWEMNLMTALLMSLLYRLSCQLIQSRKGALLGTLCVALSSPIVVYAGLAYREIPVALLLMTLLYQGRQIFTKEKEQWYSLPFLVLLLVLLGPRYSIPALPFIVYLVYSFWKNHDKKMFLLLILVGAGIFVALGGYYIFFQKNFLEQLLYGESVSLKKFPSNFTGLFFDQQWGIFFVAPVYVLFIFGFITFYQRSKKEALALLFMCIPYILFVSFFVNAFGWASPAPRYLVCILPIAGIFLSAFFSKELTPVFIYLAALLGFFSGIISWIYTLLPSLRESLYHSMKNQILSEMGKGIHADIGRFFPSFLRWNEACMIVPILGLLIIGSLIYMYLRPPKQGEYQKPVFQPVYFSFFSIGIVSVLLNSAVYTPVHIIEPEDGETTQSNVGRHYPRYEKVSSEFENNEENFGLSMNADGFIKSYSRIPQGLQEITLLSKSELIHGLMPFVRVNIGEENLGQSAIMGGSQWQKNTFIGENDLSPAQFQMKFLNYCKDTVMGNKRTLYINKFIFEPSQLQIHPVYNSSGKCEISFDGTLPKSTKTVSFKMDIPHGDYIVHVDFRPEYKDCYDPSFGLKVNSVYLGRILNGNNSTLLSADYWARLDSNQQDLQMVFSEVVFRNAKTDRVSCPVSKISLIPLANTATYGTDTQHLYLFQFSQQILSCLDSNSIVLSMPAHVHSMIGILWARVESKNNPVQLEIKNRQNHNIGKVWVSSTNWEAQIFTIDSFSDSESLTLALSDSIPKDKLDGGPYLYLHKLLLFPETAINREKMKIFMETHHG